MVSSDPTDGLVPALQSEKLEMINSEQAMNFRKGVSIWGMKSEFNLTRIPVHGTQPRFEV